MDQQPQAEKFFEKLKNLIVQTRPIISVLSQKSQESFIHFEKVYVSILDQWQAKKLTSLDILNRFEFLIQLIKRFRREAENTQKFNSTDYHAFIKKHKQLNIPFIPLVYDIKLDFTKKISNLKYEDLININFNHHFYTNKELCLATTIVFDYLNKVWNTFPIEKQCLEKLIIEINLNYNIVSYHNFTHAFALFQLLFSCFEMSNLKEFVSKTDFFAALLACLAHDLNHKGVNNLYKLKKSKKLKRAFTETAILESMHSASFFNILAQNKEIDIFKNCLDSSVSNQMKNIIISSILATDMGKHNKLLSRLEQRINATVNQQEGDKLNDFRKIKSSIYEDKKFLLSIFVHACDISNPCLEWDNYMKWSFLLQQEFHDQTVKEEKIGLEVLQMFKYKDKATFMNGQTFFLKSIVYPLWKNLAILYPPLKVLQDEIDKNLEIVEREKIKLTQQK